MSQLTNNYCLSIKQKLYIIAGLLISFLASRFLIFLIPIELYGLDSFTYLREARGILSGDHLINMVRGNKSIDLPIAYPYILSFFLKLKMDLIWLVVLQHTMTFFSSLFLIYSIYKTQNRLIFILSILIISILFFDSSSLKFDTLILIESFYTSSIRVIVAFFILGIFTHRIKYFTILSALLIVPALFRSNGLFVYFLLAPMIYYGIAWKLEKRFYFAIILPFVLLNLSWAVYNYATRDYFMIGDLKRVERVVENNKEESQQENIIKKKSWQLFHYVFISQNNRSFLVYEDLAYYYHWTVEFLENEHKQDELLGFVNNKNFKAIDKYYSLEQIRQTDINETGKVYIFLKGPLYLINKIGKNIFTPLMNSIYWLILFYFGFFICLIGFFKSQSYNKKKIFILSISLLHISSIILISIFHGRSLDRYEYPTSFIIFIAAAFIISFLYQKYIKPDAPQ